MSGEAESILKLFDAGMSCARVNLSYGTQKQNARILRKYFEAKRLRPHKTCGLMVEVRGREIRINEVKDGVLQLKVN